MGGFGGVPGYGGWNNTYGASPAHSAMQSSPNAFLRQGFPTATQSVPTGEAPQSNSMPSLDSMFSNINPAYISQIMGQNPSNASQLGYLARLNFNRGLAHGQNYGPGAAGINTSNGSFDPRIGQMIMSGQHPLQALMSAFGIQQPPGQQPGVLAPQQQAASLGPMASSFQNLMQPAASPMMRNPFLFF